MASNTNYWALVCVFLIGIALCYLAFPREVTVTKTETVYQDKIVNVSVPTDPLSDAKSDFWDEFTSDSDYWTCGRDEYRLKDIEVVEYKDYSVEQDGRDTTYNFEVRLRFDEEDVRSCFDNLDVEVYVEHNEQPEVTIN